MVIACCVLNPLLNALYTLLLVVSAICEVSSVVSDSETVACQGPLSLGFSRQEYWSGLPCPPPGALADPKIKPVSQHLLHWPAGSLPLSHQGSLPYP